MSSTNVLSTTASSIAAALLLSLPLVKVGASTLSSALPRHSGQFIQQRAYDPITVQFGLPAAAARLQHGELRQWQLSMVYSNVFMGGGQLEGERLFLDGESAQLNLDVHQKINACWQVSAQLSWLTHYEGVFDEAIDEWHKTFGLPDAHRDEQPFDRLVYRYINETGDGIELEQQTSGLGDTQVHLQYALHCDPNSSILRGGLKLPSGRYDQFLGSGEAGAFVDWQLPWATLGAKRSWLLGGSVGLLRPGQAQHLAKQKPVVGFGLFGLNYRLNSAWGVVLQLNWHTPLFDSELTELGHIALQGSLGVRYRSAQFGQFEVSFSEDAAIDTAPDIAVRFAWTPAARH